MTFHLSSILILTVVLICMENTFWHISGDHDGNFVELFKKSFKICVESGTIKKMEADIFKLGNEQGGHLHRLVTNLKDCKAEFLMFITEHYLRKIHCFFLHLTHDLITIFKYSPPCQWGSSF